MAIIDAGSHRFQQEGAVSGVSLFNLSPTILGTAGFSIVVLIIISIAACCLCGCCVAAMRFIYFKMAGTAARRVSRATTMMAPMMTTSSMTAPGVAIPQTSGMQASQGPPFIASPPQLTFS